MFVAAGLTLAGLSLAAAVTSAGRGVALVFAAASIYAPPLRWIFKTAALPAHDLLVLACFPVVVRGSDEL